ncbi:MAG: hypothetical protein K0R18_263 [Bacillales bacterium]|jgi:hypothetical protein|nr:hypothetical protein [Bacillales bacterium]
MEKTLQEIILEMQEQQKTGFIKNPVTLSDHINNVGKETKFPKFTSALYSNT